MQVKTYTTVCPAAGGDAAVLLLVGAAVARLAAAVGLLVGFELAVVSKGNGISLSPAKSRITVRCVSLRKWLSVFVWLPLTGS